MGWIRSERVHSALKSLGDWHASAPNQGSKHLLPLLALLEKGAGVGSVKIEFKERPDEYNFWDRYFKLGGDEKKPYFNPLTLRRGEVNYPHSNAATIRKNTFANKWKAGVLDQTGGSERWSLSSDYAEIFVVKALSKAGETFRVPVVDLAVVLFRDEEIDPETAAELEKRFRARFRVEDDAYHRIFVFHDEESANIFGAARPADTNRAIETALIQDEVKPSSAPPPTSLSKISDLDDPILIQVQEILSLGTSGIILTGAPGTGKTYYAQRIAETLAKDADADIFRVQFHPSFGYEDFVEGYKPDEKKTSGFGIVPKVFVAACNRARALGDDYVVFIVDEINRGDPARIFGELLTYLERSYRGRSVTLPFSGEPLVIPANLLLVGTMNPNDRSVSHVDAAFVRRFDHIRIDPSREVLEEMLEAKGLPEAQVNLIGNWFDECQKMLPVGLGHALFADVKSLDGLKATWRYRIRPTAEALMETNPTRRDDFVKSYEAMIRRLEGGGASE